MLIGIPKEIKAQEFRVSLTPASVHELVIAGHDVIIEKNAGAAIGFDDPRYQTVGARIAEKASEVWGAADIVVKVKEPQASEFNYFREGLMLFTYLHLAADTVLTKALQDSQVTAIAYETVTDANGHLPLLTPMSEIAGRYSVQAAARALDIPSGGPGILLGGVTGVPSAQVLILGGGVVGLNAARMALGLGAKVTILDRSLTRLRQIDEMYNGAMQTCFANTSNIEEWLPLCDIVIGAVLIPGASAPKLISREQLQLMKPGSVLADVAIDQGGCFETSKPTSHANPTFQLNNITHYCVANIPGAVAQTASIALSNATLPYVLKLANSGLFALQDRNFRDGLNVFNGLLTHSALASSIGQPFADPVTLLPFN